MPRPYIYMVMKEYKSSKSQREASKRWNDKNKLRVMENLKRWQEKHPEKVREYGKKSYSKSNSKNPEKEKLLCSKCNTAVGLFHENIATMERAIQYLKDHQTL